MPYPEIYRLTEGGPRPVGEAARSLFADGVDRPAAEAIVDHLRAATAPLAVAQLRVLGGAMRYQNDARRSHATIASAGARLGNGTRQRGPLPTVVAGLGWTHQKTVDTPSLTLGGGVSGAAIVMV
jgi:hypothetical protein